MRSLAGLPELDPRVTRIRITEPRAAGPYQCPNGFAVYQNAQRSESESINRQDDPRPFRPLCPHSITMTTLQELAKGPWLREPTPKPEMDPLTDDGALSEASWKRGLGKYQANFSYWIWKRSGEPFGKGHLDITDMVP